MSDEEKPHEEIIIVRRGHDDHDDHHGGAWKVAFADFMTAMMAFFLVMWLINASNEETKKAVASYFNPIKLTDRISNPKGIRTPKYGDVTDEEIEKDEESTVISNSKVITIKGDGLAQTFEEQALFADPYALLAEISSGLDTSIESTDSKTSDDATSNNMGLSGGEAFKDPFDPSSWNMNYNIKQREGDVSGLEDQIQEEIAEENEDEDQKQAGQKYKKVMKGAQEGDDQKDPAKQMDKMSDKAPKDGEAKEDKKLAKDGELEKDGADQDDSELVRQIRKEIQAISELKGKRAPQIIVKAGEQGTTITVFDKNKTGMFNIGSAKPTPELVRIMGKIGEILSREKGKIIVGGHTDGRKFQSDNYDNWRLSTARAHMAYYMLVRGGIPENRFEMISGYGDVKLAVPDDPYSPINRRIEISLKVS